MAFITPNQNDPTQPIVQGVPRPPQPAAAPQATATGGMAPRATTTAAPASQGTSAPAAPPNLSLDTAEDDSVQGRLAAITSTNSPIMKQARSSGMRSANARGLLNSSIAVGAAEDSAYRVAAPMASQEAAQAAARNQTRLQVSGRLRELATQAGYDKEARAENFSYQSQLNAAQYAAEWARLEKQLDHATASQATEIKARMDMLDKEYVNQSKLSTQNFGQQSQLQEQGFKQTQQLNQAQYAEERVRLERQLENANLQQRTEIEARINILDREFNNQSRLSTQQFNQQQELQKLGATLQSALQSQANTETLGRMAVEFENQAKLSLQQHGQQLEAIKASGDQDVRRQAMVIEASMQELTLNLNQRNTEAAVSAAMNLFNAEASIRAAIMANDSMPAAERQAYMNAVGGLSAPVRDFINKALSGGSGGAPAPATGMAPPPAGATTASGYTADGQPIYRDPIAGGGYTIGGMNPYVNWQ